MAGIFERAGHEKGALHGFSTEARWFTDSSRSRFTVDGDTQLERRLARICEQVRCRILQVFPRDRIEAVLLGGGYGRGEGGVLQTPFGDEPYNDLEFYVFMRGSTILNERRHGAVLDALGHEISERAGIEVEFKLFSLSKLRRSPVSMFSYDLVMGHQWVLGSDALLSGCEQHRSATAIPMSEATRLLMNRFSGLLFARDRLNQNAFDADDADFVARNIAKARLALGDAVLTINGRYHWSCRERSHRLETLNAPASWDWFPGIVEDHQRGTAFKLHPRRTDLTRQDLSDELRYLLGRAKTLWMWVESIRLGRIFTSPEDYALAPGTKCPEVSPGRSVMTNARRFGLRSLATFSALKYPRDRMLRSLPLLLWAPSSIDSRSHRALLQRLLMTNASSSQGLLAAYQKIWQMFR